MRFRCGSVVGFGRHFAGWAELYLETGVVFCADVGIEWMPL
jgi:hypothetical protein